MDSEVNWKKAYHVRNQDAIALLNTWRNASTIEKPKIERLLIDKLSYMVHKRVNGHKAKPFYHDILQEGILGLVKSFYEFNPSKGHNFFIVAKWYISSYVRRYLTYYYRTNKETLEEDCNKFLDERDNIDAQYERLQKYQILKEAISNLPQVDQNVINMRFGMDGDDPQTMQKIGDMFSVSKQRIDQIQTRALTRLKKELHKNDVCEY